MSTSIVQLYHLSLPNVVSLTVNFNTDFSPKQILQVSTQVAENNILESCSIILNENVTIKIWYKHWKTDTYLIQGPGKTSTHSRLLGECRFAGNAEGIVIADDGRSADIEQVLFKRKSQQPQGCDRVQE